MGLELERGFPTHPGLPRPLFDQAVLECGRRAAADAGVRLHEGVYGFCSGPTYETRAEIAFYRLAGAQAVGMSTASEVLAAANHALPVLAVSCITNVARTVRQAVSHAEVTTVAAQASDRLQRLVHAFIRRY
jgi:purine-nucleoside phosphorylase